MPYSAGTIILQVVPSYLGFQDENKKLADDLARTLDESLDKGAASGAKKAASRVNKILGEEVGKGSEKHGEKAAEEYAGAFRTSLQNAIRKMEKELKPIELRTASDKTLGDLEKIKTELNDLAKTKIEPGMDTRDMERSLTRMTAMLDELKKSSDIDVKWDVDEATKTFNAFKKRVDDYKPKIQVDAEVNFDPKVADRQMGAFETALKKRLKKASEALGDGVSEELRKIKTRIEGLRTTDLGIDMNTDDFQREVNEIERELAYLAATTTEINIHADASAALDGIESAERARERLDGKNARVEVKVDGVEKATSKLALFDRILNKIGIDGRDVANSFRFFSFAALAVTSVGAALIPIFAALSAGAVGLGVAAIAGAAGLGILAVAFSGIKDAVSALNDQQDNAAKDAESTAKRMKAASEQVADAERSLARARQDAAQATADAQRALGRTRQDVAESIEDAERSLDRTVTDAAQRQEEAARRVADARESAARAIEGALRRQQDAEQRLAGAQRDAAKAQLELIEARKEAQKELEDLEDRRRRNELDQRQAVIDLFNATVENNAAQSDPGATNLEREQAEINKENAELRLKELRDAQKELDQQASKGVNNSDRVKTAQDRVTEALRAQKEAQEDLANADKDLTRTRLDSAKSIQDALEDQKRTIADNAEAIADAHRSLQRAQADGQQSIADAQRNLQRAQANGQQSIADAQRNLQRAQERYNDALKETSASADKVKTAMDALGPAGRDFALFIHSLRDDFREIRDIIQAAFLPPLTEAMKLIGSVYGPEFKKFAGDMAAVFGELAVISAQIFTNDDFKTFFRTLAEIAPVITKNFGVAFLQFLQGIANIAVAFAPLAVEMSEAFLGWSQAFLDWTNSPEGQKMIQDFLAYVERVGPKVVEFFGALVLAIVNLAVALAPYAEDLLEAITDFLLFIANMDPESLGAIVISVLAMVAGFQALAGAISLLSIIASPIGLIALAVFALGAAFVYLFNTNDQFREFVERVWPIIKDILSAVFDLWQKQITGLYGLFGRILDILETLWHDYLEPFFADFSSWASDLWDTVQPILSDIAKLFQNIGSDVWYMWDKIVRPVLAKLGEIAWNLWVAIMTPALNGIKGLFEGMGQGFKATWDTVISPVFGWIMDKLGIDDKLKENGGGLVGAFRSAVKLIGTIWDTLRDIAKKPIDFIVGTVINKGLIGGFNALAKHLPGLDEVQPIPWPPPGFSRGGIPDKNYGVRFGYSPGRDNQLIAVGGGEAILRPEATRALGPDWVNAINKRARLFGVQGVANLLQGFKSGGLVEPRGGGGGVGEFDITRYKGHKFNYRTIRMLQAAERLAGQVIRITQGSYSTSVAASGSTHAGGGAFDAGWPGSSLGQALVAALRMVGFAAWHRDPSQGRWNHHIHGIAAGDPTASAAAQRQVRDYYNGGNGLGGKDDGPNVKKDPSLLDKIKGGVGGLVGWVADAISNPIDWLRGKIAGNLEHLTKEWGDNTLTKIVKAIPEKIITGMADMISGGLDFIGVGGGGESGPIKDMVKKLAENVFGWTGGQWSALERLVQKESSWNPNAQNPTSTAYGLFQFLDGTWGPYGQKTSDPRLQAQYGMQYIKDRYGDPESALAFHNSHNWYSDGGVVPDNGTMMYDNGGYLPPGVTTVVNLTGKPEPVFTAAQFEGMKNQGGSGLHYEPHFYNSDLTADDVMDDFRFEIRRLNRGS